MIDGSDVWVAGLSKLLTLSCDGTEIVKKVVSFPCGDINFDGIINESDVDAYTNYIFYGGETVSGVDYDLNDDGFPDAVDLAILIDYVYYDISIPACSESNSGNLPSAK